MPQSSTKRRPLPIAIGQVFVRWFFRISFTILYRIRVHDLKNYPAEDGLLVCANHQSFLDPLILGVICPRPVNYLGRKTLFKFPPLAWFLKFNDTIPIDREGSGIGGIKETLRCLKRGESVVMYPEGTRTDNGEVNALMLGFCAIARRSKSPLMPIGFDGAFQAFPRHRNYPLPGRIHAVMGKPIYFKEYESLSDQEMADLLEVRIRGCFGKAQKLWKSGGLFSRSASGSE